MRRISVSAGPKVAAAVVLLVAGHAVGFLPAARAEHAALALGGPADSPISWLTDFEQMREQAEILRRPVMIDFWASWCRWCHELDRKTYAHPEVIRRLQSMTCGKVNTEQQPGLGRRFGVRGLPTVLFLDRHGQEIDRLNGFVPGEPFAQYLDDVMAQADHSATRAEELRRDPRNPVRVYALADELIAQGRLEEAEPLLARLTPVGADAGSAVEAEAVLDLAVVRAGRGDRERACAILTKFLTAYPHSPRRLEAALRLGQLLAEKGEIEAARAHLERVAAAGQGSWKAAEARRLLGHITGAATGGGTGGAGETPGRSE